ncbi:VanZ family protein [Demequina capsici]|uniref:VanZ family protein n=1 Tax=Demequina capsici TaxID=3075620 RepID=A0AA96JBF2_9MICO|nr:VanZ family protein [Demequina sp. PMTSA13]WNM28003.1 VanZ family protein [Demequina sp. PMTSA13]
MFATWASPAFAAVVAGGALWALFLAPLLLYQVRAYGGLSIPRAAGSAAVSIYAVALVAYTLLPTPGASSWCAKNHDGEIEIHAFHSIAEIRRQIELHGVVGALTTFTVLQVVMNVVLFIPWGLLARRYFHMPFALAVLSGAFGSFMIETLQFAGGWTLIGCQYRVADIDDLIANTLGTLLGAVLAPTFLFWMPRARDLARLRLAPRPVTGLRRAAAMLLDLALLWLVALALAPVIVRGLKAEALDGSLWSGHELAPVLAAVVVVVPTLRGTGATPGERMLWLRPAWPVPVRVRRLKAALRPALALGVYAALMAIAGACADDGALGSALWLVSYAWIAVVLLWTALDPRGGLQDAATGATTVDARGSYEQTFA